jgi:DNA-binding HxlR family transcriptional regulator
MPMPDALALLQEAAEIAGDRWVLLTLAALGEGPRRFGDLAADLPGIAPNILIDRLRRMERHGLIGATPYSHRPRRFVYDLTESGRELAQLLPALSNWAARRGGVPAPHRHIMCDTPLEARQWCPTCATVVENVDDTGHHGAGHDGANLRWL